MHIVLTYIDKSKAISSKLEGLNDSAAFRVVAESVLRKRGARIELSQVDVLANSSRARSKQLLWYFNCVNKTSIFWSLAAIVIYLFANERFQSENQKVAGRAVLIQVLGECLSHAPIKKKY